MSPKKGVILEVLNKLGVPTTLGQQDPETKGGNGEVWGMKKRNAAVLWGIRGVKSRGR